MRATAFHHFIDDNAVCRRRGVMVVETRVSGVAWMSQWITVLSPANIGGMSGAMTVRTLLGEDSAFNG